MESKASAIWNGGLKDGNGSISGASGVFSDIAYTFATRFEGSAGTNPEELIAAAHAGCFSMALSAQLGNAGLNPESISTTATSTLENSDDGVEVTKEHLDVTAKVPGASQDAFDTATNNAKPGCPISKLLDTEITLNAVLEA